MNYAKIKPLDIANGEGIRVSLFVSGCPHHCQGCFNPETWRYDYGEPFTEETTRELFSYLREPYIKGLSVLGGEPLVQGNALTKLLHEVKTNFPNKDIWLYTGYVYEDINWKKTTLKFVDVLVDGPFVLELKDPKLKFRGSSNQRIIDVKKSREQKKVVLYME